MTNSKAFYAHVLKWVQEEIDPDATEVTAVQGYGSDFAEGSTEEGFSPDNCVEIEYVTTTDRVHNYNSRPYGTGEGDRVQPLLWLVEKELRGDRFQSLWYHVVNAWQVPERQDDVDPS